MLVSPLPKMLQQTMLRIRGRFGPHCVVLLYHRIAEPSSDVYRLCVSPKHFEEHLQVIRDLGTPVPLSELAGCVRNGKLPDRAVCVTFDDGYQDNLYAARPLLERYDIPATVFMTTGRVGRDREFWWDELEAIFLDARSLPSRLEIEIKGHSLVFDLNGTAATENAKSNGLHTWSVIDQDPPTSRHAALKSIYPLMRSMSGAERTNVLDKLQDWTGREPTVRPTHRALEAEEVLTLDEGNLVEVGGHTIDHPDLTECPLHVQRNEISQCKVTLEQWLGHPIQSFAYPYGLFSEDTVSEVRHAGYKFACACLGGPVRRDSQQYLLPRVDVTNANGEAFSRELETYFQR